MKPVSEWQKGFYAGLGIWALSILLSWLGR
jgi:hypothetical protein